MNHVVIVGLLFKVDDHLVCHVVALGHKETVVFVNMNVVAHEAQLVKLRFGCQDDRYVGGWELSKDCCKEQSKNDGSHIFYFY